MQFQADILGIPVLLPEGIESTASGRRRVRLVAGTFVPVYNSMTSRQAERIVTRYIPHHFRKRALGPEKTSGKTP